MIGFKVLFESLRVIIQSYFQSGLIYYVVGAFLFVLFLPKIKGWIGEKVVSSKLKSLDSSKYKVINNLLLKVGNKTSQIDHVVISVYGIFVIETKNYKGWIYGSDYDEQWKQVIYKRKYKMINPVKQNYGHVQALKEHLGNYPDVKYIPIVAFLSNCDLKVKTKSEVIYSKHLLSTIKKYNENQLTAQEVEHIYSHLLDHNQDSKENQKQHVISIKNDLNEKKATVQNNTCPKCGGTLVARKGKYGDFKGCTNYPKCRFTN